jgi:hypothetical protein
MCEPPVKVEEEEETLIDAEFPSHGKTVSPEYLFNELMGRVGEEGLVELLNARYNGERLGEDFPVTPQEEQTIKDFATKEAAAEQEEMLVVFNDFMDCVEKLSTKIDILTKKVDGLK